MTSTNDNKVLEHFMVHSLDMICTIDQEGKFVQVSQASERILGYAKEKLEGHYFLEFVHPHFHASTLEIVQETIHGKQATRFENYFISKNGEEVPLEWTAVWSEEEKLMFCVGRDGSKQVRDRQKLLDRVELHQALTENGSDMLSLLDAKATFLYSGGGIFKTLGYAPEHLLGVNAFSLLHPDDIPKAEKALATIFEVGSASLPEFRFKHASGEWRWLETVGSNQLHNPKIKALVLNSHDITERVNNRLKLQESEQRFKALFENNPDMILVENREGIILDANPAFLLAVNLPKEKVINKPVSLFLPTKAAEKCLQKLEEAFLGKTANFNIELTDKAKKKRTLNIKKIPVQVGNEIIAVNTVIKDISEVAQAHQTIKQQAEKLSTIFESITDAFFTVDKDWNFTFINRAVEQLLQIDHEENIGKNLWELFTEEVDGYCYHKFLNSLESGTKAHFESFIAKLDKWFEVKTYPSEEGLSVYFSDITARVKSQQELEKLSLVASKTTNGVVITDANGLTEWVNDGFTRLTGYTLPEIIGKKPGSLLQGEETDPETVQDISIKLKLGVHFNAILVNYTKAGEKRWISMQVTPIFQEDGKLVRFIAIQRDVTFRKEIEASQLKMTQDLYEQNRDLQQFTYIVSHNLRAPVANALGLADLLTKLDRHSGVFDRSLSNLKKSVFKLDTVLRDLNMILSIRDKQDVMEKEQVNIYDVCEQVCLGLQESLMRYQGSIAIEIERSLTVSTNKAYLYSIFYNLLSNAIKYRSEERPLKVLIKGYQNSGKGITISFSDNGSGFDLERAGNNIFKLYKRFHTGKKGRGIGLFLVKTHVEAMGGKIDVTSQINVGTKFLIHLS